MSHLLEVQNLKNPLLHLRGNSEGCGRSLLQRGSPGDIGIDR